MRGDICMALVYDVKYAYNMDKESILDAKKNSIEDMDLSTFIRYLPYIESYADYAVDGELNCTLTASAYLESLLNTMHTIANSFTVEHRILQKRKYIEYIVKGSISKFREREVLADTKFGKVYQDIQDILEFINIRLADTNTYKGDTILRTFVEFDNYNLLIGFRQFISKNTATYAFNKIFQLSKTIPPKANISSLQDKFILKPKIHYISDDIGYGTYDTINPMSITMGIRYRYKTARRIKG